jgi:branched-chain amino acid transport system substrate-binding protein
MHLKIPLISSLFFLALTVPAQKPEPVKIGLLVQDNASLSAKQGAELAVKLVNEKGGINGRPLQIISKSMEGPWGTGSKQAVELIFEENVWALLGSHDGRNAHLVEQAATKSIMVFLSAWSTDPTLSQAFVPWFFNCVPNDYQQAVALIEEIYKKSKTTRVTVITDKTYESNMALKNFRQVLQSQGKPEPAQILFDDYASNDKALVEHILKTKADYILLLCKPSVSLQVIRKIRQGKISLPVCTSLTVLNEDELSDQELKEFDQVRAVRPATMSISKNGFFKQAYKKYYGNTPGLVAAYAFDGMNVLIEAIRMSGSQEREKIQEVLSEIHYEGVTGHILFDERGNRKGPFIVTTLTHD